MPRYGIRVDPSFWIDAIFHNIIGRTGEYPNLYLLLCKHDNIF